MLRTRQPRIKQAISENTTASLPLYASLPSGRLLSSGITSPVPCPDTSSPVSNLFSPSCRVLPPAVEARGRQRLHFVCRRAGWNRLEPAATGSGLPHRPALQPPHTHTATKPLLIAAGADHRKAIPLRSGFRKHLLQVSSLLLRCCHQLSRRGRSKTRRRPHTAQQLFSSDRQAFCRSRKQRPLTKKKEKYLPSLTINQTAKQSKSAPGTSL